MMTIKDRDLVKMREVTRQLSRLCADLTAMLDRGLAPQYTTADDKLLQALPRTQAIEAVLTRAGHPLRPVEIWQQLHDAGRDDPKMEVQVTTFDLWKRGRIGKVGRGLYTSGQQ